MGGQPSLGYDVKERKLVVNEAEAATVRYIFRRYLELGAVRALFEKLRSRDLHALTRGDRRPEPQALTQVCRRGVADRFES